jgi:hypothetical protein
MVKLSLCLTDKTLCHEECGGVYPLFLYLSSSWRRVISFSPPPPHVLFTPGKDPHYPLDRRLDGPQSRTGQCGEVTLATAVSKTVSSFTIHIIALDGMMMDEWWISEDLERSSYDQSRYDPGICLEELEKTRVGIAHVLTDFLTKYPQNMSLEHYQYANPLCVWALATSCLRITLGLSTI